MIWSDIMLVELSPHTPLPHDVEFNHPGIALTTPLSLMIWSDIILVQLSPHTPLPHDVEFNHPGTALPPRVR
jgi:hypothetical protein